MKKVFLFCFLFLLMLLFNTSCVPTEPEPIGPEFGDIDAHYYRMATEQPWEDDNPPCVQITLNGTAGKVMIKIEKDHYQLTLKDVRNNMLYGERQLPHLTFAFDYRRGKNVVYKLVLNGTELNNFWSESRAQFWFDAKNVYN